MKILLIPAVFIIYSGLFPFFEGLLKKIRIEYLNLSNCYVGEVWLKIVRSKLRAVSGKFKKWENDA